MLDRIDITSKSVDFNSEILLNAWISGSLRYNHHRAIKEFPGILPGCGCTSTRLKHPSHDQLLVRFFVCPKPTILR
jgi:hypothetical protein